MFAAAGSSPLTRGKLESKRLPYAGVVAHPRSRGENLEVCECPTRLAGSSPLTRGKPCARIAIASMSGLIPAHAGKTNGETRNRRRAWAHPRSRGENHDLGDRIQTMRGSSPLTRGKHRARGPRRRRTGLIPAHAGKTSRSTPAPGTGRAHPRSRGENAGGQTDSGSSLGSSPLTRGKRARLAHARPLGRLIPAHAGKTRESLPQPRRARAHPRSRGENERSRPLTRAGPGSSPLTRGKLELRESLCSAAGLIPAHAGKTVGA